IHFNAGRNGLRGIPKAELPRLLDVLGAQGHLLVPVVVIFLLLLEGFTATYAALVATVAVVYAWLLGRWVWPLLAVGGVLWRFDVGPWPWVALAVAGLLAVVARHGGTRSLRDLIVRDGPLALRDAAYQTVPVAMATAAAGIMIGIILQTGL